MSMKRFYSTFILLVSTAALVGCATPKAKQHLSNKANQAEQTAPGSTSFDASYTPSNKYSEIDLRINKNVEKWIKYFTGRGRKYMQIYLQRSSRYIPMMKSVFRERGMPEELSYIAMIESGFSAKAFSHASAVGYWQFIRGTGKRYDLKINSYVDERRDPILSTQAAANYLDALYDIFGDWHLAMGGYNAGENRILRAIRYKKNRDFWYLSSFNSHRILPRETRNYVPKYIAATLIAKNPALYGFVELDFQPQFDFDTFIADKPISLLILSKELGVEYEELKRLNPRYKSDYVPIYEDRTNAIRVPVGMKAKAIASINKIYSDKPLRYAESFQYYRVRRGDTLSGIAHKFRTSISYLRELNNMSRRRSFIRVRQKLKVPDGPHRRRTYAKTRRSASSGSNSAAFHKVRRGETLSGIAEKYRVGLSKLRRWNNLRGRALIRVGQKIRVRPPGSSSNKSRSGKVVHTVRRGENLTTIARKYNTTVRKLASVNKLRKKSLIHVGKKLVIK